MTKAVYGARASETKGAPQASTSRTFQVSEDIPIAELEARVSDVVHGLKDRRPLVITLNGKPAAVVMSPQELDRLTYRARVIEGVAAGLADAGAGNVITDEELRRRVEQRYSAKPR